MIDLEQLRDHLGTDPADTADDRWMADTVAAVNAWVAGLPVLVDRRDPDADWPPDVTTGAVLLAAHLYHSRSAPYGRATMDMSGGFSTAFADPEIARLLRLRKWARPLIAGPAPCTY